MATNKKASYSQNKLYNTSNGVHKRKFNPKKIINISLLILLVVTVVFVSVIISQKLNTAPDLSKLETLWNESNFEETYSYSHTILLDDPFNNTALTYNGYSAFYLALSSTDTVSVHTYIDNAINSIRLALLDAKDSLIPQLEYMLGKVYFHKNRLSAYYFYSDLAIKYLHKALDKGYNASDIYEYLGLSYASLDMTEESIVYFTEALLVNDSDVLKIAIAEQYYKIGNFDAAKPYLQRIKNESDNEEYIMQVSNLLGLIYVEENSLIEAENEFTSILQVYKHNTDALYGLGLIYEKRGETYKARAQWRQVLEIDSNHNGARLKMN